MNELYRRLFKAGNQTACRAIETRWLAEMRAVLREEEARPREHVERFWMPEMDDEAEFCFDEMSEHYWKLRGRTVERARQSWLSGASPPPQTFGRMRGAPTVAFALER